ncbi:MAG: hypothetical protein MZU95_09795 [Desulfomicrobium escambiense]|nr:hypothetical protein [Desulfomicrobium escambiense]
MRADIVVEDELIVVTGWCGKARRSACKALLKATMSIVSLQFREPSLYMIDRRLETYLL